MYALLCLYYSFKHNIKYNFMRASKNFERSIIDSLILIAYGLTTDDLTTYGLTNDKAVNFDK